MHGIGIGHDWEFSQINVYGVLEHALDHVLENVANLLFVQERCFNINLCEFWLTVSAQIFIAETFDDLVIAVVACHHQQLFEQLW